MMKGFDSSPQNLNRNGGEGLQPGPDSGPTTFNIKVSLLSHGLNQHEVTVTILIARIVTVTVPSNSTFGNLKSTISQKIGVNPETHKLLFRGKEKEDNEEIQTAGIKNNSKVLIMEDIKRQQKVPEEVKETSVTFLGGAAVAEVRKEVDKLSEQVSALQAVVNSGTRVDDKDIIYVTEMLMRQLLKLDGIEAEGEAKVQRKMEVRRVQSFVETMDILKSRNSNSLSNANNTVSVTTQWETFEPTPLPSSTPTPPPPSTPAPVPSSTPTQPAPSTSTLVPSSNPSDTPSSTSSPVPSSDPSSVSSSTKVTQDWEQFD